MSGFDGPLKTEHISSASQTQVQRFVLRVTQGKAKPAKIDIGPTSTSVGQSEANDVCVDDGAVSRFHFEITREAGKVLLRDLDSTNGTKINGVSVHLAKLRPGQTIRAGRSEFVFEARDQSQGVPTSATTGFGDLVGASEAMRMLYAQLEKIAPSEATALILGESGTGKELVAHELHRHSDRKDGPFIIVDCGALPEELIESELFGHKKGAFTGATVDRIGAFEAAHGGTLFLDEIGELPLALQPKLLRVLESRTIRRIGDNTRRPVDVRFVAATHRNLRAEVNAGTFREDLFWRLAVMELRIPPLRERREDIPLLAQALWSRSGLTKTGPGFDPDTLEKMQRLPWRGNVRELRNFVERAAVFGADALPMQTTEHLLAPKGSPSDLPQKQSDASSNPIGQGPSTAELQLDLSFRDAKEAWVERFERQYLAQRLEMAEGNMSRMARETSMDRAHLLKLLRKHGFR